MLRLPLAGHIVVRYRKPIWMPTAPSKLFKIPEHKLYSEEEVQFISKLTRNYKTQLRSIQALMREQFYAPTLSAGGLSKAAVEQEAQEEAKLLEENNLENMRIARFREVKWVRELGELEKELFDTKISAEEKIVQDSLKLDEHISQELVSGDLVTPDNIDEHIELALSKTVLYDYCVDTKGKKYA